MDCSICDTPIERCRITGWEDGNNAEPVNEGWLYNKDRYAIKIFASYDKDEVTKEITFGDRTMIPLSCVKKMIKLN